MNQVQAGIEMPKYRCHKEVHALKIESITLNPDDSVVLDFANPNYADITVPMPEAQRFKPFGYATPGDDKGYLVSYKDGYISWSPTEAFEDGYSLL